METANPYSAPASEVCAPQSAAHERVRFFSFRGRLGRLRYLAYLLSMLLIAWLAIILLSALTVSVTSVSGQMDFMPGLILGMTLLFYASIGGLSFMLAIRRIHDFDMSGWFSLFLLVPYLNILFGIALWFIPGSAGPNRFGEKTPPNSTAVTVMAIVMPLILVFIIGILAAIAIPQYQKYVERSQQQQQTR